MPPFFHFLILIVATPKHFITFMITYVFWGYKYLGKRKKESIASKLTSIPFPLSAAANTNWHIFLKDITGYAK